MDQSKKIVLLTPLLEKLITLMTKHPLLLEEWIEKWKTPMKNMKQQCWKVSRGLAWFRTPWEMPVWTHHKLHNSIIVAIMRPRGWIPREIWRLWMLALAKRSTLVHLLPRGTLAKPQWRSGRMQMLPLPYTTKACFHKDLKLQEWPVWFRHPRW